jgi:hypothetical protein
MACGVICPADYRSAHLRRQIIGSRDRHEDGRERGDRRQTEPEGNSASDVLGGDAALTEAGL